MKWIFGLETREDKFLANPSLEHEKTNSALRAKGEKILRLALGAGFFWPRCQEKEGSRTPLFPSTPQPKKNSIGGSGRPRTPKNLPNGPKNQILGVGSPSLVPEELIFGGPGPPRSLSSSQKTFLFGKRQDPLLYPKLQFFLRTRPRPPVPKDTNLLEGSRATPMHPPKQKNV